MPDYYDHVSNTPNEDLIAEHAARAGEVAQITRERDYWRDQYYNVKESNEYLRQLVFERTCQLSNYRDGSNHDA